MAIKTNQTYSCGNCVRRESWGKYNCKKCSCFYTSEWKGFPRERVAKTNRGIRYEELIRVYDWLRDNVFPKNYVPHSKYILFSYKRNGGRGGWCNTPRKEIRMPQIQNVKKVNVEGGWAWKTRTPEELKKSEDYQVELMLHEMLHLRMPHHKKSFRNKEKELLAVLRVKKSLDYHAGRGNMVMEGEKVVANKQ